MQVDFDLALLSYMLPDVWFELSSMAERVAAASINAEKAAQKKESTSPGTTYALKEVSTFVRKGRVQLLADSAPLAMLEVKGLRFDCGFAHSKLTQEAEDKSEHKPEDRAQIKWKDWL